MKHLNKTTEWPTLAVYDIESENWTDVVLLCHIDEDGNKEHFNNVSDYLDWLFADYGKSHVWAHAGGRFDHRFLIPEAMKRGWDFRAALTGGTIVLLIISNGDKKIYFADSFRIMPNALKSIGKTVGLEKLDVDRTKIHELTKEQQIEYCFRDCEIALQGLQLMKHALEAVNADFAFTLASIASRWVRRSPAVNWEKLYHPEQGVLKYDKNMVEVDKWSEPAYFGGRTEMFRRGTFSGTIYYYDIVSSYPTSMQYELPLYFKGYFPAPAKLTDSSIEEYLSYPGITECWVNIPRTRVAPLCVKFNGRLTFPYGHKLGRQLEVEFPEVCICRAKLKSHKCTTCGRTYPKNKWVPGRWTNIELMAAFKRGAKILPIMQARFEGVPFLKSFVDTFYSLRKKAKDEKDAFRTYAYKVLLNSLYGKLVETIDRSAYVTSEADMDKAKKEGAEVLSTAVPGVYCVQSQTEGPFRHVAAGAYVTAYSRLRLLEGLEAAQSLGGDIYYCDTDSIMTNVRLDHLAGNELGDWNLEKVLSEIELVLPKVYRTVEMDTGKVDYRCKGMPIVRENEPEYFPKLRWEAFKQYNETKDPEMAKLLGKDGLTGFVADIAAGSLHPRTTTLLRCLTSTDRKRNWSGSTSWPLNVGNE